MVKREAAAVQWFVVWWGTHHGHVRVAGFQPVQQSRGPVFNEGDPNLGAIGTEGRQRAGHKPGNSGRERAHAQLSGIEVSERLEVTAGGRQAFDDDLCVLEQSAPGLGQGDPAWEPIKKCHPGVGLQRGDLA